MSRAILLPIFAATVVVAGVPVTFSQGSPAKADEVNKNFNYLDSAVGKKASQASLDAVAEALKSKADASALSGKADQSKLDDLAKTVAIKSSQSYVDTAIGRRADTSWVKAKINAAQSTSGALLASKNLSDLTDKGAARTILGLGALATKSTLSASDVGALDSSTSKSRFILSTGEARFGGDLIIGDNPLRRNSQEWILGANETEIKIGSSAPGISKAISLWHGNGEYDTSVAFYQDACSFKKPLFIAGEQPLVFTNSGSGVYTRTALYINPPTDPKNPGILWEIPRIENSLNSTVSNFEISFRGGHDPNIGPVFKYEGSSDILYLSRATKIRDLTVSGSVKTAAGTIKSSDVADYVFEPDYKLMPLAEVEAFTKANKHLPEVPSAAEIEKSGLDLAKMNLLLLKKVEELTLHTIELEKRLKAIEAKD